MDKKGADFCEVIISIIVICRLIETPHAKFKKDCVVTSSKKGCKKKVTTYVTNYNYVCIMNKTWGRVFDRILKLCASKGLKDDDIAMMFDCFTDQYIPATKKRYHIEENRLVVKEDKDGLPVSYKCMIIDHCNITNKARFSFHVAFLKDHMPDLLDNVDHMVASNA